MPRKTKYDILDKAIRDCEAAYRQAIDNCYSHQSVVEAAHGLQAIRAIRAYEYEDREF